MKQRILYTLLVVVVFASVGFAQKKGNRYSITDEDNAIFKNEWSLGARFHTNGFSTFFERVWIKNIYKKNLIQASFFYYKDFKEQKVSSNLINSQGVQKKFIYGKQNTFFTFDFFYGQRKVLANKMDKNGVRVSMMYGGGVTLGILKPYYLEFTNDLSTRFVAPYSETNDSAFLDVSPSSTIIGAAGARYGFNQIKLRPGIQGKFGFNFDWANREYFVKALELGAQVDIFYKGVDILISDRSKPYIFNLYLQLQLGKRW